MKERERTVVTGLVVLMLVVWIGFLFHRSPRFAGSFWGGLLGVSGALMMLVPLAYLFVKRIKWLRSRVKKRVSMRTLLAWHVYAGIIGPILVLLHTGHKFVSPLGITLTTMTLIVVLSGFVGRYLMSRFSTEVREKKAMLTRFQAEYQQAAENLAHDPRSAAILRPFRGFLGQLAASVFVRDIPDDATGAVDIAITKPATVLRLSQSIADVEYAIKTHELFKKWFGKWLKFHIAISMFLYLLMALHIWAAVHFGVRWFEPWRSNTSHFVSSTIRSSESASRVTPSFDPSEGPRSPKAVDQFSGHFGQLFSKYWRAPVIIRGIRTTVFDYAGIASEVAHPESDFSQAQLALERVDPDRLGGGNREKAFWINVYNFGAMKLVAENYPVSSITDSVISDGDPWGIGIVRIGEAAYSLKQIENAILLEKFDDPRIVFAVSCAAVSCPDRTDEQFAAEQLDQQLDDIVRGLLANSTKGLAVDQQGKVVTLSWILKADRRLFGDGSDDGLLDFVQRYVSSEIGVWINANRGDIKLEFFEHDWGLNDTALANNGS